MYPDFYKMYVMIYSDLHASGADFELYCTDASMHLVSHLTVVYIKLGQLRANLNDFKILILNMPWGHFSDMLVGDELYAWPALWPYPLIYENT